MRVYSDDVYEILKLAGIQAKSRDRRERRGLVAAAQVRHVHGPHASE